MRRRDWAWHVVEEIVRALFWFHPAIWWATDRIRLSREQTIDALVVEATRDRRSYMETLLHLADQPSEFVFASPFGKRRHLMARMRALASPPNAGPQSKAMARLALGSILIISLTVACALPWQQKIYLVNDQGVTKPSVIREDVPSTLLAMDAASRHRTAQRRRASRWERGRRTSGRVAGPRWYGLDDQARLLRSGNRRASTPAPGTE